MPGLLSHYISVVLGVLGLQLVEAVDHRAVALLLGLLNSDKQVDELWSRLFLVGELASGELYQMRKTGDGEAVAIVRDKISLTQFIFHAKGEEAGAVEDQPRDAEFFGDIHRPGVEHVGDDGSRAMALDELLE